MNSIYKRNNMYMSDGESFVVSEFDIMDDSLVYTLDFSTKGNPSIFSNIYDTEHEKDTWEIVIDQNNLFYPALLEFLKDLPSISFTDKKFNNRSVTISLLEDMSISIRFNVPDNRFNVVNVKIAEDDPNYDNFMNLIGLLNQAFTIEHSKRKRP
ncbi:MAG: hypothetical protein II625_02565 [Bacilli bacterium]|nr:hypothetical protein [Bacilli bacterium]